MSWIDVGIIALVVLLGLFGVLKGFKKSLLSMGAFLIAFLLAFFLANVIAEALLGIDGVKNFVLGNGFGEKSGFSLANFIYKAMGDSDTAITPDSFIFKSFYTPIMQIIAKSTVEVSADQGLALYLAFIMFSAICGVGIFIIARFLLVIVTVIVKSYIGKKKSPLSRLFGFVLGVVRGAMWSFAITLIFTCFGGLTFMPGVKYIEDEYEHKNAVFCQYFNEGAYYIRNKLFLPDADMYGRIVGLVFKKEQPEKPDEEKLTGERLELFINVSNLNYEDSPWTIDQTTKKRKFDEQNATPRNAEEFADVGFDSVIKAILDYNTRAAALIDNETALTEFTELQFEAYNGFVQNNSISVYKLTNSLITALHVYQQNYRTGLTLTDPDNITAWNNTTLSSNYNDICELLDSISEQYGNMPELGAFPDLDALIPERVSAGPKDEQTGGEETGEETGGEEQQQHELATERKLYAAIGNVVPQTLLG